MMTGAATVAYGEAQTPCVCLMIPYESVKKVLIEQSDISDIFVSAFIVRRALLMQKGLSNLQIVGSTLSPDTYRIQAFLMGNSIPHNLINTDKMQDVEVFIETLGVTLEQLPLVIESGTNIHKNPSNAELAELTGTGSVQSVDDSYDVAVIGAGPAGLAASINAASEGWKVLLIDASGPGGQSSGSAKIENYMGFPTGISGRELAEKGAFQAQKFGVQIASNQAAEAIQRNGDFYTITLKSGGAVAARAVIISTGAQYQKLAVANLADYEGRGVFYGSTGVEAAACKGKDVAIVGAANSAGQAAVFLSKHAKTVYMFVRAEKFRMSTYLKRRIESAPNIIPVFSAEITALNGTNGALESINVYHKQSNENEHLHIKHVFSFIGATPCTQWLNDLVPMDDKGFIKTGNAISPEELDDAHWPLTRSPEMFETALPMLFAVGDVRSGSSKRVASAVGQGSVCIGSVDRLLQS